MAEQLPTLAGVRGTCPSPASVRFSLEDLQRVDLRPPILFLRAFGDDHVPLKPEKAPLLSRLLEFGRRRTSLDELLLEQATPYGPVVGLGNPRDRRPP